MQKLFLLFFTIGMYLPFLQAEEIVFSVEEIENPCHGNIAIRVSNEQKWDNIIFFIDSKELGTATLDGKMWTYLWKTTEALDGEYKITAQASKNGQRYLSKSCSAIVDNTPPTLIIRPPKQVNTGLVTFEVEATDEIAQVLEVLFWLDQKMLGIGKASPNNIYTKSWRIPEGDRGYHLLEVECRDKLGNRIQKSEKIRLDRQGPRIQVLAPLAQGPTQGPLMCEAKISDISDIGHVEFTLKNHEDANCTTWHEQDRWGCKWDNLPDGMYQISVIAWDTLGNRTNLEIYTQIDTIAPLISWRTPSERVITCKPIDMEVDILDDGGILNTSLQMVDMPQQQQQYAFQRNEYRWQLSWTPPCEGEHRVRAITKDVAGNINATGLLNIVYDTTAPQGKWLDETKVYYTSDFHVKIHAEDELSGIDRVEFLLGETSLGASLIYETEGIWDTQVHIDKSGVYYLQCVIWVK